jgi:hypothetical protein
MTAFGCGWMWGEADYLLSMPGDFHNRLIDKKNEAISFQ